MISYRFKYNINRYFSSKVRIPRIPILYIYKTVDCPMVVKPVDNHRSKTHIPKHFLDTIKAKINIYFAGSNVW